MEYMGNSSWWNERFKERELKIMKHENCLEEDAKYFIEGASVLDVACGDGRNSIYLARSGYSVNSIDFSKEALSRLSYFADRENLEIKTGLIDLSTNNPFEDLDKYDLIIINHYRLNPDLYKSIMNHLNDNGVLWVNGFSEVPENNPNITQKDIFVDEDFISLDDNCLEDKKIYSIGERKFVRYIWKK